MLSKSIRSVAIPTGRYYNKLLRRLFASFAPRLLLFFFALILVAGFTLSDRTLPEASATPVVPFFQLRQDPNYNNSTSLQANDSNNGVSGAAFKTYENPGFGISIKYPSLWSGTQLRADPSAPTNTSIVAIFEAPRENQSDSYRENLVLGVQGPHKDDISLKEYTQNSLNAFRSMSGGLMILESYPSSLSGLPAHEIVYTSSLQNLNLKKMQIFTIVNGNTAYVISFGAEDSQFDKYIPEIRRMIDSIRINQQATS